MFHGVLSRHYSSHAVAFEIVLFIRDNLKELCYNYQIFSVLFPNILKVGINVEAFIFGSSNDVIYCRFSSL